MSRQPRILGRYDGQEGGPLLLCLGGIHGNEPAGVHALQRVFEVLRKTQPKMRGTIVGLAGNLRALEAKTRYLDRDLNRAWLPDRVAQIATLEDGCAETLEQRELLDAMRNVVGTHHGEIYFLDLHTSSAEGEPFACIGDTIRNRKFARSFPVPVILGLEEQLEGALLEHLNNLGFITMGFEGGEHHSNSAVGFHEAAIWRALVGAGCLDDETLTETRHATAILKKSRGDLPQWLGIRYRHAITDEDNFQMRPGYRNFSQVSKGEIVADAPAQGEIKTYYRSRILLPLYQGKGNDGFFLALDVAPAWLTLSRWMRRMRLDRIVHWLPGVSRVKDEPGAIRVNLKVARWATVEIFHLLGFRKRRIHGDYFIVRRRKFDLKGPERTNL
ncbi:MAG: succinylglutamate desuccinylase/aspartoacylase family protein [Planctomycetota bacterium]|nr:succinylglutamate desuccinylase/aspartoacylase family protein [Planctomycetota bacterium]MDA1113392.1 succinylglutamate desuccinylase/aspartoacylase family protein [Planctomycetota bacterium]